MVHFPASCVSLPECNSYKWRFSSGFPTKNGIVVPQYGLFLMENPMKMDDLGVPPSKNTIKKAMKIVSLSLVQANQSLDARVAPLKVQAKDMRDQQQRLRTEVHVF